MQLTYTSVELANVGNRRRATLSLDRQAAPELVGRVPSELTIELAADELPELVLGSTVRISVTSVQDAVRG